MFLTGCDYMFLSLLLSVTVDVLVSTAEDDGKMKQVRKHFPPPVISPCLPPSTFPLAALSLPLCTELCGGRVIYGLNDIEIYLTLSPFMSLFFA